MADLPSRDDFTLLHSWGSIWVDSVLLPPIGGDWFTLYKSYFATLAPRHSRATKRACDEVESIVAELRSLKLQQ